MLARSFTEIRVASDNISGELEQALSLLDLKQQDFERF